MIYFLQKKNQNQEILLIKVQIIYILKLIKPLLIKIYRILFMLNQKSQKIEKIIILCLKNQ